MKIIVTGASGVVGSALLEKAAEAGNINVTALTRSAVPPEKTERPAAGMNVSAINEDAGRVSGKPQTDPAVTWCRTDYSYESLAEIFSEAEADAVVHLAGIKAGVKGAKTELSDYDEDLQMMRNILRACEDAGIRCLVYSSSRIVYGNPDNLPWTEETVPEPRMAYGINKMRCEELCRRYSEKTGARVWILRVAQVISETDRMRNMVNVFRDLAAEKKELTVIGKSVARRQYIYSRDLAVIILKLIGRDSSTGCGLTAGEYTDNDPGCRHGSSVIVNAGMELSYTNYEIALAFNRAFGNDTPVRYDDSAAETITSSYMDVSRMIELTGFHPADMDHALADMAGRMHRAE